MLQSHLLNVLPRQIIAGYWASQETRISLTHLASIATQTKSETPVATSRSFLCKELPVRCTHILRLLSALSPDALQSPILRNVAHEYLHDICTLTHPSVLGTSPNAFRKLAHRLRRRQAASLIRLRYAFLSAPSAATMNLLDHIQSISLGIDVLLDQHLSWTSTDRQDRAQAFCAREIAQQAVNNARHTLSSRLGRDAPIVEIQCSDKADLTLTHVPNMVHRVLYESTLLALRSRMCHDQERTQPWWQRGWLRALQPSQPLRLNVFGGLTSVGFRLDSNIPLQTHDLLHDIPRDTVGIPTCAGLLSKTHAATVNTSDDDIVGLEHEPWTGWRGAKAMASHWGGSLDAVSVDGLGTTIYLALDRDTNLAERYPSRRALAASSTGLLRHHRRSSAAAAGSVMPLTLQTAAVQLDAFIYAIADPNRQPMYNPTPQYHHHSVSLSAAVGHA